MEELYLSRNFHIPNANTLQVYEANGGYRALRKALTMDGPTIIDEVKRSNLRGRGGAGFPTGVKWSFMPKESDLPIYLVVNADEGEPGTFKDRYLMELDPHRLIEGCIITAHALGIRYGYIFVRGELQYAQKCLQRAIDECYAKGYLGENILSSVGNKKFDFDLYVHTSAGAYICGEETGMIEGLEGKPGKPRNKPPFPAIVGVFGAPTLVNNVESISSIPFIIERGGDWFASLGVEKNGGPKLYGLSGHIKKPGVYEAPSGITIRELLEDYGGGMLDGSELKAIVPGGSSCAVLTPEALDAPMSIEGMREFGSTMGTGCITFFDHRTCIVRLAMRVAHFYHHESCGQCTPCREGSGWSAKVLDAIENGRGRMEDLGLLVDMADNVQGNTICALGDALAVPMRSFVQTFTDEFEQHIREGGCSYPAWGRHYTAKSKSA